MEISKVIYNEQEVICFSYEREEIILPIDDITYIECVGNYCQLFVNSSEEFKYYLIRMGISKLEDVIDSKFIFNVHRTFLVNINQIDKIENNQIIISKSTIPVSKRKMKELLKVIALI